MAGLITALPVRILGVGPDLRPNAIEVIYSWVGSSSDGTVPALSVIQFLGWWITKIITNPGAATDTPAGIPPAALYDITFMDIDGLDILDGALVDRSATLSEVETMGTQIGEDGFDITISNQSERSANGIIRIFMNR